MPKISEYPAATALTDDGLLVMVESPGGTPITKKITALNAKTYLGGSTILVGSGAPAGGVGAAGNFYVDTAGDDLYGPKSATGFGAEQRITIANTPNADMSGNWCGGVRMSFVRAGRITRLRYRRLATSTATLELRIWNGAGTQVGSTINVADVGTGVFETTLGTPQAVTAGSTWTFTVGSTNPFPYSTTAQTVTSTTDCTFIGFYLGSSSSTYPTSAQANQAYYVEPVYEPDTGIWPVALGERRLLNAQTGTTYAPVVTDENSMVTLSNAAAITVTLPSDATAAFPVGAEVDFLWLGVGQPTFAAGSGATANATPGLKLRAQYSAATAKKVSANGWVVIGDLSA